MLFLNNLTLHVILDVQRLNGYEGISVFSIIIDNAYNNLLEKKNHNKHENIANLNI